MSFALESSLVRRFLEHYGVAFEHSDGTERPDDPETCGAGARLRRCGAVLEVTLGDDDSASGHRAHHVRNWTGPEATVKKLSEAHHRRLIVRARRGALPQQAASGHRSTSRRPARAEGWAGALLRRPDVEVFRLPHRAIGIRAPEVFDIHTNPDQTFATLSALRDVIDHHAVQLGVFDLAPVRHLGPTTGLLLVAEMAAWRTATSRRLRALEGSWDPDVCRLLDEMGYFEALTLRNRRPQSCSPTEQEVRYLKFVTGARAEGEKARQFRHGIEAMMGEDLDQAARRALFHGLTEAFSNVAGHAYAPPRRPVQRWWISASFEPESGTVTAMCYDRGLGIPATLPSSPRWPRIQAVLGRLGLSRHDHGALIRSAVEVSGEKGSRTRQAHRGRGLGQMKELLDVALQGSLTIVSLNGRYTVRKLDDGTIEDDTRAVEPALAGTLIEWSVTLQKSK